MAETPRANFSYTTKMACSADHYEAAARALCRAMDLHATAQKSQGNSGYRGLLDVAGFHDRCLDLACRIALEERTDGS